MFGEISLSGDVRNVSQPEARLKESAKLGFSGALTPKVKKNGVKEIKQQTISRVGDLVSFFFPHGVD
nr:hypothetical protein [Kordiimonas gwangyangensis]